MGIGKDEQQRHVARWRERKEYESGVNTTATFKGRSARRNLKRAGARVAVTKAGSKGCEGTTNVPRASVFERPRR